MDRGDHATQGSAGILHTIIQVLIFFASVFVLVWVVTTFVAQAYQIPSGSMLDTIQEGDRVWSEKISYYFRSPEPGDIVTFSDPFNDYGERTLIKRVIAVGGDTVDLQDGIVYVNGVALDEDSYTGGKPSEPLTTHYGVTVEYPYTVPEGYIWVMGDNRTNSNDSRYFGAIPVSSVTGRAFCIYWPLSDLGVL